MSKRLAQVLRAVVLPLGLAMPTLAGAATVPILNSSFEQGTTGPVNGYQTGLNFGQLLTTGPGVNVYRGLQGWTTTTGNRIEVRSDLSTAIDAQDGDYFISLDGGRNSNIQQSVGLAVGSYILSFWYSPEGTSINSNRINYNLGSLLTGTVTRGTNGASVGAWTQVQVLFNVTTAGSYLLNFAAAGTQNRVGGFLDNIQIAAVPVPAAGLGLLAGLLAMTGLRRRRPS